jgi:hypothetical protein
MDVQTPPELLIYYNCMERVKNHVRIIESDRLCLAGNEPREMGGCSRWLRKRVECPAHAGLHREKVNRNFYPLPLLEPKETASGMKHFERMNEPFLTREELEKLYDSAGEVLHSENPFSPARDAIDVHYTVEEWITRIGRLLSWHLMETPDLQGLWAIRVPSNAPAQAYLAAATGPFVVER